MNRHHVLRRLGLLALAVVALLVVAAPTASAHPLGNFTVNRYTGLLVSPDGVTLEHVVDLAEIPTAQLGKRVDDLPALAASECAKARPRLSLRLGDRPLSLTTGDVGASTKPGEGGLPITRITCSFEAAADLVLRQRQLSSSSRTARLRAWSAGARSRRWATG